MSEPAALHTLNDAPRHRAIELLAPLVERSAWVAERVVDQRPFASDEEVTAALVEVILASPPETRHTLFCAHPEIAGREAMEGRMTDASASEQARLGLLSLAATEAERIRRLNGAYYARFGHPFILALHRVPDLNALFDTFERRLAGSPVEEHVSTLAEIASVIRTRAALRFGETSTPKAPTKAATQLDEKIR